MKYTLAILGLGPFSIVNNHLACGGMVSATTFGLAQSVLIMNLGAPIDAVSAANSPSYVYKYCQPSATTLGGGGFRQVSNGTVLFTSNICQLEASASRRREAASVLIYTPGLAGVFQQSMFARRA